MLLIRNNMSAIKFMALTLENRPTTNLGCLANYDQSHSKQIGFQISISN